MHAHYIKAMSTEAEFEGVADHTLWEGALRTFEEGDYFETHEFLEELWRRHDGVHSEFYQGLLQAAVSLHHYGNGNFHGARLLAAQALVRLGRVPETFHGVDVARFRADFETLLRPVLDGEGSLRPLGEAEAPRLHRAP